jgi:quercetin dioxygenase-like cupin family protein
VRLTVIFARDVVESHAFGHGEMEMSQISIRTWTESQPPTEAAIRRILDLEELKPYRWSNAPGDVYAAHTHSYNKVIYVVKGSITFGFPKTEEQATLGAGDRLDLPAGVAHDAVVGLEGVICLEAHR